MQKNRIRKTSKILLIALVSLCAARCPKEGEYKVYNQEYTNKENQPGNIRRDEDGLIIERVTYEQAHEKMGSLWWEDINAIAEELEACKLELEYHRTD